MKIILSRKGFDSANGGIVSPIFVDGTMMSFPIPDPTCELTYDDLQYNGKSYTQILQELNFDFAKNGKNCHVDPDIDISRRKDKPLGWEPIFGQHSSAAGYLINEKTESVEVGDIFLFFGNFHAVEEIDGKFKYVKGSKDFYKDNDIQAIWGYLEVGKILKDEKDLAEKTWHPHSGKEYLKKNKNIMFVASDKLSLNKNLPGAGLLKYDEKRVLTLKDSNKATWKMNSVYDAGVNAIYGNRRNSAKNKENSIYYAGIWQELKLKPSDECTKWARKMICDD